jgi:hypothetical protein
MPNLNRLGIGGIIFLIGAVIYIINLVVVWSGRNKTIKVDGIGLMVLGIGITLVF